MQTIISYPKIYVELWKALTRPVSLSLFEENTRQYFYTMSMCELVNIINGKVIRKPIHELSNDFFKLLQKEAA